MLIYYIDPGTGSMLISAIIAMLSVAFFVVKGFVYKQFGMGGDKGEVLDLSKDYGIVFYSEGKQYWNVFKETIINSEEKGLPVVYFTSDKSDPGLKSKEIIAYYIGSGREAYYVLNRLRCEVLIMTTPGLDVLEIKRNPNIKHYSHLGHATSSVASYKSYGTDYYDSVLLGGYGDVEVIRELESVRGLPPKELKVVGHPYLDVLRERLREEEFEYSLFEERKTTILISPTWGNHGLLTKFGDKILNELTRRNSYNVIIRPHPQSYTSDKEVIDDLKLKYPNNKNLIWDNETDNIMAMSHADIMISDFSGIIFDFYTLFKKPILTIHSQYEKRGRDAMDLREDPWDIQLLDKIGRTVREDDTDHIADIVDEFAKNKENKRLLDNEGMLLLDAFPNQAAHRTVQYIEEVYNKVHLVDEGVEYSDFLFKEGNTMNLSNVVGIKEFWSRITRTSYLFQYLVTSVILLLSIMAGIKVLPFEGLNFLFLKRLLPYSAILTCILAVVFITVVTFKDKGQFRYNKKIEKFDKTDIILILLPMTPILQYTIANQDILKPFDSLVVIAFFAIISIVTVNVFSWLMSSIVSKSITTALMISLTYIIFNMASFGQVTSKKTIVLVLIIMFSFAILLLLKEKKKILNIIVSIFFISTVLSSAFQKSDNLTSNDITNNNVDFPIVSAVDDIQPKTTPDVFLLIYDSYANQETLDSYGFDNTEQINYLLDDGFAIYDGTYSVGSYSLISMGNVLHPGVHIPPNQVNFRKVISEDSSVMEMFKRSGYVTKTVFPSDYYTEGTKPNHDYYFPSEGYSIATNRIIIKAILEGEFRFDVEFSSVTNDDYLKEKSVVLNKDDSEPVFMYSHDNFPGHTPNSGVLRPNETELHIEKLIDSNLEMRKDIEAIRSRNKEAIIIVAGDHGPYLTKNGIGLDDYALEDIDKLDIQDRYGTFLAISWPNQDLGIKNNIQTIQDIFPAVASYIYSDTEIFEKIKMDSTILPPNKVGGILVKDGEIIGGKYDSERLFKVEGIRVKK